VKRLIVTLIVAVAAAVLSSCSSTSHPKATTTTVHTTTPTSKPATTTTLASKPAALVDDLTWISPTQGWALVDTPKCGQPTCTEVLGTSDGGGTWTRVGTIPAPSNCATCGLTGVSQIRFATALDGYAYDPGFFTSTDGGVTWTPQSGPYVVALEPVGSNVMRISFTQTGCPGPCDLAVQSAPVGSAAWQTLTGPFESDSVQLVRQANEAYVARFANPAGGVGEAHATLMLSQDGGTTWGERADPCGEVGGAEFDATSIAAAPQGVLAVLCVDRAQPTRAFVDVSTDSGVVFAAGSIVTAPSPLGSVAATSASNLFAGTAGMAGTGPAQWVLMASQDGGQSWQQAVVQSGKAQPDFGAETFLGFENSTVGRWVGYPYDIWQTTDGGAHWVKQPIAISP
jgi:hypothetical protein